MEIGFVPSVMSAIADWAAMHPHKVLDTLSIAQGEAAKCTKTVGLSNIHLFQVDNHTDESIAVGYDDGFAVVFAAKRGLAFSVAEQTAARLSRQTGRSIYFV